MRGRDGGAGGLPTGDVDELFGVLEGTVASLRRAVDGSGRPRRLRPMLEEEAPVVSLRGTGQLVLNAAAYEAIGRPPYAELLIDPSAGDPALGIRPASGSGMSSYRLRHEPPERYVCRPNSAFERWGLRVERARRFRARPASDACPGADARTQALLVAPLAPDVFAEGLPPRPSLGEPEDLGAWMVGQREDGSHFAVYHREDPNAPEGSGRRVRCEARGSTEDEVRQKLVELARDPTTSLGEPARRFEPFADKGAHFRRIERPTVGLRPRGRGVRLLFSGAAYHLLRRPEAVEMLFDRERRLVGIRWCPPDEPGAFKVSGTLSKSSCTITSFARAHSLWPAGTQRFVAERGAPGFLWFDPARPDRPADEEAGPGA